MKNGQNWKILEKVKNGQKWKIGQDWKIGQNWNIELNWKVTRTYVPKPSKTVISARQKLGRIDPSQVQHSGAPPQTCPNFLLDPRGQVQKGQTGNAIKASRTDSHAIMFRGCQRPYAIPNIDVTDGHDMILADFPNLDRLVPGSGDDNGPAIRDIYGRDLRAMTVPAIRCF